MVTLTAEQQQLRPTALLILAVDDNIRYVQNTTCAAVEQGKYSPLIPYSFKFIPTVQIRYILVSHKYNSRFSTMGWDVVACTFPVGNFGEKKVAT